MTSLTALIITKNESANIGACLESISWVDEIIVIDSESTDDTREIASRYTPHVIVHAWPGYSEQRNYGHTLVTSQWILTIDADERVTPALQAEIQSAMSSAADKQCDAYRIPIQDWMFGKFIHYGSWPNQTHLRLYKKGQVTYGGAVHEGTNIQSQSKIGSLSSPLLHYSHLSVGKFINKLNTYTELEAQEMYKQGQRVKLGIALLGTVRAFLGQYVKLQGFRDGGHGLILAIMMAGYYFATRAKLWSYWYMQEHPQGSGS
jgi:glycosyltransferase involved in cell wall biosynthesis